MREEWLDLGAQVSMTFTFPGGLCAALEGAHPFTPNSEGPSAGGQSAGHIFESLGDLMQRRSPCSEQVLGEADLLAQGPHSEQGLSPPG